MGKHQSKEEPPCGPIWGNQKPANNRKKDADSSVDKMASAFTHMAHTVASAINPPVKANTPTKSPHLSRSEVGIAPGRRIELQEKLFKQIDMLHQMYERGAITSSQFEDRRESLLMQMDKLAE